jgi:hypothetical protein
MALWFVSSWFGSWSKTPRTFVTKAEFGQSADAVHAIHTVMIDPHIVLDPPDPSKRVFAVPRPDGAEFADETSYFDRQGVRHTVLVDRKDPTARAKIAAISARMSKPIAEAAARGDFAEARSMSHAAERAVDLAKSATMSAAVAAALARYPQWSRWHADDEARGVVRSDSPSSPHANGGA